MATKADLQKKLQEKLRELFQLAEPDLDFGFYRVMHAKAKEIDEFIETTLPARLDAAFAASGSATLKQKFEAAKAAVLASLGPAAIAADGSLAEAFAATPAGSQYLAAKAALEAGADSGDAETDVYDHLYHFFERYYDKGDFVSLRYLTRETSRKAKPYAIPYAGEEVMLHWANADQYYIKTSENFSHFSFDLARFAPFQKMDEMEKVTNAIPEKPMPVHFEVVEADEGEHGNVKAGKDRFFILHAAQPFALDEKGLHIYFEHREDPDMTGRAGAWQDKLRDKAIATLREVLGGRVSPRAAAAEDGRPPANLADYARLLFLPLERTNSKGAKEKYTPIATYLKRYMARNTSDYFIHKNLGAFLERELDFYIKNDLMVLDDVAEQTPENVAKWLGKLKVFRSVAHDIIAFLAQLEDFQKKLWLKKKFVVECEYCLTLDRVPNELLPEVFANSAQKAEWERLGLPTEEEKGTKATKETKATAGAQGELALGDASVCPSSFVLRPSASGASAPDARMVDTRFFPAAFKEKLLAAVPDLDDSLDGVLVHGDNFQALGLMQERYREQIKCIYIDPPYNTDGDGFIYKDNYRSSSWLASLNDRLHLAFTMLQSDGTFFSSIDYHEIETEKFLLETIFRPENFEGLISWRRRHNQPNDKTKMLGIVSEYLLAFAKDSSVYKQSGVGKIPLTGKFSNPDNDPRGPWASKPWKVGSDQSGSRYTITSPRGKVFDEEWMGDLDTYKRLLDEGRIYFPSARRGEDGCPRKK